MTLDDFIRDTELIEYVNPGKWEGVYETVHCKRALSPSGLPRIDYALNPYGGCEHGCIYCYAPEVTHSDWSSWRVVKVRVNIVDRLARELSGLRGTIGIGTSTDPYQGAERRFLLTRRCLETLHDRGYRAHIITKSDLILRDIKLLKDMDCEVGITLTGLDDRMSKITEPGAPLPEARLEALRTLVSEGIDAYALVEPVLNHLDGKEEPFCEAIASTGVSRAEVDGLNARPGLSARLDKAGFYGSEAAVWMIRKKLSDHGLKVQGAFTQ